MSGNLGYRSTCRYCTVFTQCTSMRIPACSCKDLAYVTLAWLNLPLSEMSKVPAYGKERLGRLRMTEKHVRLHCR